MRDLVKPQEATEHDAWFCRQVQMGLDAANAGKPDAIERLILPQRVVVEPYAVSQRVFVATFAGGGSYSLEALASVHREA